MTKQETLVFNYEHCGECPHSSGRAGERCDKGKRLRIIKDLWGEIPDWCPLPDKEEG